MATTVTVKGQVTIPKAVRDAAGIKPGDRVEVRAGPGGILIGHAEEMSRMTDAEVAASIERAIAGLERRIAGNRARGIVPAMTSDEVMALTRGEG